MSIWKALPFRPRPKATCTMLGAKVIGMTNMTEARLAREAEISLATISMATDYDCWRKGHESVTVEQVMKTAANVANAKKIAAAITLVADHKGRNQPLKGHYTVVVQ